MSMLQQMFNFAQQVLGLKKGKKKARQLHTMGVAGRPANVLMNGTVLTLPAIVQYNAAPHVTKEGKPVISRTKASQGGQQYQVMYHRAVDRRELRKAVYQAERAARGRYVGPFSAPVKAVG